MASSGKALILSFHFPPVNGPAVQHALWFHRYLPEFGIETTTISSSAYAGEAVGEDTPVKNRIRVPESALASKISYRLHYAEMLLQNQLAVWEHGFVWAEYAVRKAVSLLKTGEYTHIISVSPFTSSHWAACRIKRKFPQLTWIADFQDPFIGNPFHKPTPVVGFVEHRLEKLIFGTADLLSANTDTVRTMWAERYPQYADKLIVTWGGYDPDEQIHPLPIPPGDRRVISHTGSVYSSRLPQTLLHTIADLASTGRMPRDVQIEFFGPMETHRLERPEEFEKLQRDGWITLTNSYVSRHIAIEAMCRADYLLLLDITHPHHTILQVPSKLFDYIRVGRPVLAFTPPNSPTARILGSSGIPHVIVDPRASGAEITEALSRFIQLPTNPVSPSEWFVETFDARNIVRRLAAAIHNGRDVQVQWPKEMTVLPHG